MGAAIAFILRYRALIAVAALTLLLGIQTARIASLKASHAQYVAKAEKARADAVAAVLARERASAAISQQVEADHEKTIADLRAAAARRLQGYTGRPGPVPVIPHAPFKPDEAPGSHGFCIETPAAVALMLAADENTQQLIDLQGWIAKQQKVPQ